MGQTGGKEAARFRARNEQTFATIDAAAEQLILLLTEKASDQSSIELSLHRDGAVKIELLGQWVRTTTISLKRNLPIVYTAMYSFNPRLPSWYKQFENFITIPIVISIRWHPKSRHPKLPVLG